MQAYILNGKNEPVPEQLEVAMVWRTTAGANQCIVGRDQLFGIRIATSFTVISSHSALNPGKLPPLFETCIFYTTGSIVMGTYYTYKQAEIGHKYHTEMVRKFFYEHIEQGFNKQIWDIKQLSK